MTGTSPRDRRFTDTWAAPALVAAVAALVFLPSIFGAFVWDDRRFIAENPAVVHPTSWLAFFTDAGTADSLGAAGLVRPLRTFEFALDYALFGESPLWFHVHSLFWHALAAALGFLVLRRLLGDGRPAFVAALFWAVHPAQTEAVAFVSSRGDVAMGACALGAVLFALRSRGFDRDLALSLVLLFVATLYKETAVALVVPLAVLRWTKLGKAPLWPHLVVVALYFVYRAAVQTSFSQQAPFWIGGSVASTFATMFRGFGFYVAQSFLPAQAFEWDLTPSTSLADGVALAWLAAHLALVACAVTLRRRSPLFTVAVAWFYALLLPVSNWPVNLGIPTTERFLYVALLGVALAVGVGVVRAGRGALVAALVAVVALAAGTLAKERMWRNEDALWTSVLEDHESTRAHNWFAMRVRFDALDLRDRAIKMPAGDERRQAVADVKRLLEQALDHAHRASAHQRAFEGGDPRTQLAALSEKLAANLCYLLTRQSEALFHADEAIRIGGDVQADAHHNRALALLELGYPPRAVESMERAWTLRGRPRERETADFFLRAAKGCDAAGLFATAERAYSDAFGAAPAGGPLADEAGALLDALRKKPRPADAEERERATLASLDASLAALPRSCPAR